MEANWIRMPEQTIPQLALIIPTYRWDALAKDTLTQAAAIGSEEICVHFGDNSTNPEKHAYLRELAARSTNVRVTCHPTNLGADGNWLGLVRAQTAPFICMAADDDSFSVAYFRCGLALVRDDPACATASGLHVSVAHDAKGGVPVVYTPAERREANPLERIRNYRGENSICYAISRRSVITGFAAYIEANPLQCPFNDYMLAFHLLSMGAYRMDRRGYAYIYDHTNWNINDAFIKSNSRWYKGYSLPEEFGYLTRLHWAVVAVHFFSSDFRSPDLPEHDAEGIVAYLFDRQRREFAQDYKAYKSTIESLLSAHPQAAAACARLMKENYDRITRIFDDFALVVAVFSPDVARRYRAFQAATLRPHADAIKRPVPASTDRLATARARVGTALRRAFG